MIVELYDAWRNYLNKTNIQAIIITPGKPRSKFLFTGSKKDALQYEG